MTEIDQRTYRVTIADEKEETIKRFLLQANVSYAGTHAEEIYKKTWADLELDDNQAQQLRDMGFQLFRVLRS